MKLIKNRLITYLSVCLLTGCLVSIGMATRGGTKGRGNGPIILVTSQGLYYDSIVTADPLPPTGPFQQLVPVTGGLKTEFGPGDKGYVGGRWWVDVNGDHQMDPGDHYFSCPLLGPGRDAP